MQVGYLNTAESQGSTAPRDLNTYMASTQARLILARKSTQIPFKHLDVENTLN